jgi:EAL domain-containing protein (putative c-di-GMP-specific phosphodiesterase class I)
LLHLSDLARDAVRAQQLQAAMASGADLFQGYLIGRPSAVCLPLGHAEPRVCEMSA